jgi:rare lipoprotein A
MLMKSVSVLLTLAVAMAPSARASSAGDVETGLAAVYADALNGHATASGQIYDRTRLTAAHKTLPFGTTIKVTNQKNGKSVVLRVNDRGPRQADRVVDISPAAATRLGFGRQLIREVMVEVVAVGSGETTRLSRH